MKKIFFLLLLLCSCNFLFSQSANPDYDAALAKKLGADEYGMKTYMFVMLKTGENKTTDQKYIDSCFAGHISNIGKLVKLNQLIVAGPFGENNNDLRGLFILNVDKLEEAQKILATDPAIHAKLLRAEITPWYASAALSEYLPAVEKIQKVKM